MRSLLPLILCSSLVIACKSPPPEAPLPPPIKLSELVVDAGSAEEEPTPDVGNADDLYQRAFTLKDEHPGEAIRLYRKSAELAPNDKPLQEKLKEQLKAFEPLMKDRAREAYLLGFQLRESSPNDAILNFEHAMDLTPRGDPLHEKAKAALAQLKKRRGK